MGNAEITLIDVIVDGDDNMISINSSLETEDNLDFEEIQNYIASDAFTQNIESELDSINGFNVQNVESNIFGDDDGGDDDDDDDVLCEDIDSSETAFDCISHPL